MLIDSREAFAVGSREQFFFRSASCFCTFLCPKAVLFILCVSHSTFLCIAKNAEKLGLSLAVPIRDPNHCPALFEQTSCGTLTPVKCLTQEPSPITQNASGLGQHSGSVKLKVRNLHWENFFPTVGNVKRVDLSCRITQ